MYCTCGNQSFTAMHDRDAKGNPLPESFNYDFWVCARCLRPSRLVFTAVTIGHAPARATAIRSIADDGEGRSIITWATDTSGEKLTTMTFKPYPRKADMPQHTQGRNICLELWIGLDSMIDTVRDASGHISDETKELEKVRAQLLAKVIALVMSPFYEDETAVLKESMARWTARQAGEERESPGLAEAIWSPNTRFDGTPYTEENERTVRAGRKSAAPKVELDDQKIAFIKHSLSTGALSAEVMAGMFGCTVEQIKEVTA